MAMEERILKCYDTFEEFPDGILVIKENTNVMYIQKGRDAYIAREFLNSATGDELQSEFIVDYKDVITGKTVLTSHIIKTEEDTKINYLTTQIKVYDIIPLDKILNINGNKISELTLDDICVLINFKEQEPTHKRKFYF